MMWKAKTLSSGTYKDMKTPSTYKIDWEDLDNNSYRSKSNGNLVRSIVSKKWFKGSFNYNYLTENEAELILQTINAYPLYIQIKSPLFGINGLVEMQAYVSKVSIEMNKNEEDTASWINLSFNIVQSKRVSGQ